MKKKLLLASASILALGIASAQAADIPQRMPAKAPMYVAPVYNWTGPYIGINGGGGWGRSSFDGPFTAGSFRYVRRAGRRHARLQLAGRHSCVGVSKAISTGAIFAAVRFGAGTTCETPPAWLGTVRGRLGYDGSLHALRDRRRWHSATSTRSPASAVRARPRRAGRSAAASKPRWSPTGPPSSNIFMSISAGGSVAGSSAKVHDQSPPGWPELSLLSTTQTKEKAPDRIRGFFYCRANLRRHFFLRTTAPWRRTGRARPPASGGPSANCP